MNGSACCRPAVVAGPTGPVELVLNVAAESLGERAYFTVRREDGATSEFELNLWDLPQAGSVGMNGSTWVQKKKATLPIELPLGYHEVAVKMGDAGARTRYIVTPDRAYTGLLNLGHAADAPPASRSAFTACVPITGNWGCGDFARSGGRDRVGPRSEIWAPVSWR